MSFRIVCLLVASLALPLASGCSDAVTKAPTYKGALTLENGHRFVESIDGDKVVLKKKVDKQTLPFKDDEFMGKNIVIHPPRPDQDGLFARVTKVSATKDRLTLTVRALDLAEMAEAAKDGDDTLTIHRNASLTELPAALGAPSSSRIGSGSDPFTTTNLRSGDPFGLGIRTETTDVDQGSTNSGVWPPTISSFFGLNKNIVGAMSVTVDIPEVSFTPGLSAKWIEGGIQVGADMKLSTRVKVDFKGAAVAQTPIYEKVGDKKLLVLGKTEEVKLFEAPVTVGGVYTTFGVKASLACFAKVEEKFSGTLELDLGASLAGSVALRVKKQSDDEPTIGEGDVPFSVSGHATPDFNVDIDGTVPSIACEVPRLQVYVQPGGRIAEKLGGPTAYVGMAGRFSANFDDEPSYKIQAFAGVNASPLGKSMGAETVLATWTP